MTEKKLSSAERFNKILERMEKEQKTREDVTYMMKELNVTDEGKLKLPDGRSIPFGEDAFADMCEMTSVPLGYATRLQVERGDLLAAQFNHFLKQNSKEQMFRIKNDTIQGIVSPVYGRFDNYDFLQTIQEKFAGPGGEPKFELLQLTESDRLMNMRVAFPDLEEHFGISNEDGKPDIGRVGLDFSNSEIGYSKLRIIPITYRLVCTNGMRAWKADNDITLNQRHIHIVYEEVKEDIFRLSDKAVDEGKQLLTATKQLKHEPVEQPYAVIENMGKELKLSKDHISRLKDSYKYEDESTMFGILNAFTRFARGIGENEKNHELRYKIEQFAGDRLLLKV